MLLSTLAEEMEHIVPQSLSTPEVAKISPKTINPLWQVEKNASLEAIEFCNGNVVQAAKLLEIGKTTLYRKLQKWNYIK
jgi:transcriptional regulator of acetoin/glycerol metabolism